jgi:hypothetical protein
MDIGLVRRSLHVNAAASVNHQDAIFTPLTSGPSNHQQIGRVAFKLHWYG